MNDNLKVTHISGVGYDPRSYKFTSRQELGAYLENADMDDGDIIVIVAAPLEVQ